MRHQLLNQADISKESCCNALLFVYFDMTDLLMFPKVESFIYGRVNSVNLLFLLLSLPYAHVGLTKSKEMELLLHHVGLQLA